MESDVSPKVNTKDTPSKELHNIEMMCSPIGGFKTPGSSAKKLGHPLMMSSPSPAPKLPGTSTRNELYLKSVLSPYHKNYTPLSATPTGVNPVFRTPVRSVQNSPAVKDTPDGIKKPINFTPQRTVPKNPFEYEVEHLEGNIFMSPGVFSMAGSTPATDEKKAFRWSIEHLAVLHPADIDEMPHQQDPHHGHDKETEEKAQRAIDTFFQNNLVAPSPAPGSYVKATPGTGQRLGCLHEELQGSIQKQLPVPSKTGTQKEASCQTVLSLPVDFDINSLLGQFLQNQPNQEENQEMLSTSSLRRKLFFQGDNSGIALSPVKGYSGKEEDVVCASPAILPSRTPQKQGIQATPLKTPSRDQFSSSPIKNVKGIRTPLFKGTPGEDFLDNLGFSPIVHGHMSRVRSSEMFNPHDGSFVEDDCLPIKDEQLARPLQSPELFPIKPAVLLKTPSTKSSSATKLSLKSPGVSPIALASPEVSPCHDGSFIQSRHHEYSPDDSDEDMKTPLPAEVNEEKLKKAESCRKISTLGRHKQRNIFPEFDDTAMDFEPVPIHKNLRFADVDDIRTSSLLVNRESSYTDMEYTHDNAGQPNSTSQDTGYQTTSLQLTNQTGSSLTSNLTNQFPSSATSDVVHHGRPSTIYQDIQHTNLTAQFGSMPTNSSLYEGDSVLDCHDHHMSNSKEELVHHILDITNPEKFGHAPYSEEEILERARKVLQLANEMYPESNTNREREVQDICDKTGLSTLYELEPIVSPKKGLPFKSASDQALEILRRAGEDLAEFGHLLSSIKTAAEESKLKL